MTITATDSPLLRMTQETPTQYWNDSCAVDELAYAVERGATGATSNPSIVLDVMKKEKAPLGAAGPRARGRQSRPGARSSSPGRSSRRWPPGAPAILRPVFDRAGGRDGRLSVQTNPANHRDPVRMVEQAVRFASLAPNIQVKFPVTAAGHRGDRGGDLPRRQHQRHGQLHGAPGDRRRPRPSSAAWTGARRPGDDVASMTPIATIMIGRLDDWMKVLVERDDLAVHPDAPNWAGRRRVQARLRDLPRARLPDPAARRGLPPPPPLDRARRRRRQHDAPLPLAGPLQRQRDRPGAADGRAGRPGAHRRPLRARSRTSGGRTSRTA